MGCKCQHYFKFGVSMFFNSVFVVNLNKQMFVFIGKFDMDDKLGTCSIVDDKYGRSSKTSLFVIAFVIPCLIIIGCYTRIFWVVHE